MGGYRTGFQSSTVSILSDIQAEIATLTKLVPTPQEPLGYGRDLVCVTDLTADMLEEDPESPVGIMNAAIRFLTTDRDSIPDAPGRGWNVRRLLNRAFTTAELLAQEGMIMGELEQDDRIDTATAKLELNYAARSVQIRIQIKPRALALQPFDFIVAVTDGAAHWELLK
jgi:hypothetical protein